jgi:hypothetical protein
MTPDQLQARINVCQGTGPGTACEHRGKNGWCFAGNRSVSELVTLDCPLGRFPATQSDVTPTQKKSPCGCKEKPLPAYRPPSQGRQPIRYKEDPDPQFPVINSHGLPALGLQNSLLGAPCFLVGGGPSLNTQDLKQLQRRGVLIAAMNQIGATHVRPHIWFSADQPSRFHENITRDPGILLKFWQDEQLHHQHGDNRWLLRWTGETWQRTSEGPSDYPGNFGYHHRDEWTGKFLDDPIPTWGIGRHKKDHEGVSHKTTVMLPAIWLLYWLGVREIYLLGCDFKQRHAEQYAFDDAHAKPNNVDGNNGLYKWLNKRFAELIPHFQQHGLSIINCTPGGGLTAFPRLSLEDALCRVALPPVETVKGLYL